METAVITLAVCLSITSLAAAGSVPLLWWLVLRHSYELEKLREQAAALRSDVDKLDAVLDGMISGRPPE